ncbi:hypothetical protein M407DRAFT_13206 [Tulasnella calospora MUT 4182]|uniref:Uncharacterized protein n=1 Tax=Tulasnella calospora MUT 4182 TaxID=1051891 RepID=A0A0C3Q0S7_9AGAM|nr:hypothetical protein M407DRAFT_13206 [Tulasnella calospora MUT 4182]
MSTALSFNETACGYDADDGSFIGCSQTFPNSHLQPGDLCRKCKAVFQAKGESERETVASYFEQSYPQCTGCGLTGRMVKNPCGTCERLVQKAIGKNPHKEAGASARAAAMGNRVGGPARSPFATDLTNRTNDAPAQSIGPATSEAELEMLKTARAAGNFSILFTLIIHGANGKTVPNSYGQMNLLVDNSETMQDILGEMVDRANQKWVKNKNCYRLEA